MNKMRNTLTFYFNNLAAFGLLIVFALQTVLIITQLDKFDAKYTIIMLLLGGVCACYAATMLFVQSTKNRKSVSDYDEAGGEIGWVVQSLAESQARERALRAMLLVNAIRAFPKMSNAEIEAEIDSKMPPQNASALNNMLREAKQEILDLLTKEGVLSQDGSIYHTIQNRIG